METDKLLLGAIRQIVREEIVRAQSNNLSVHPPVGLTNKPLYKIKEVCLLFSITKPTVYDWIRTGKLHPVKINSRVYFRGKEVEALTS